MRITQLAIALVLCGVTYGATYHEGPYADGFEHDGPIEPEANEVVPSPPKPEDSAAKPVEVAHKGSVRAAPLIDTANPNVQKEIVKQHNDFRRGVATTGSFEFSWDAEAAKLAQDWVNLCDYRHPTSTPDERNRYMKTSKFSCGQNIASFSSPGAWSDVTKMWYDEVANFKMGTPPPAGKEVGHYTAIMWAKTHKVGCGTASCNKNGKQFQFYACNYCPAGNITPNQYTPYIVGTKCAECSESCNNGLCTNPCPYTNAINNCETKQGAYDALFPGGCANAPSFKDSLKPQCKATCECYGKMLY